MRPARKPGYGVGRRQLQAKGTRTVDAWRNDARHLDPAIAGVVARFRQVVTLRDDRLFTEFLPRGYRMITLSSVPAELRAQTVLAKMHLALLITLCDDLADNPKHCDPVLLAELAQIPFRTARIERRHLSESQARHLDLGLALGDGLVATVSRFPFWQRLSELLAFDFEQIHAANRYSQQLTRMPCIASVKEARIHTPYGMGVVAAGMIDLFASPELDVNEIGACRTAFLIGQRLARISNTLASHQRERVEGDVTNELIIAEQIDPLIDPTSRQNAVQLLVEEFERGIAELHRISSAIRSFDVLAYATGLRRLDSLHNRMAGI